jgi:uncharacterized protein YukE
VFLLGVAVSASAQVRLYDAAGDDLAKKTRDAFAEFSKGDGSVFETMTANTLALKDATLAQLYDLNQQSVRDTVNEIPVKTWKELRDLVKQRQGGFLIAFQAASAMLDPSSLTANSKGSILTQAKARLEKLQGVVSAREKALTQAPKPEDLRDSVQKVRDALAASAKPVKKLSDLKEEYGKLKSAWAGTQASKDWFDSAEKSADAPGLELTMLDLGVQHQQYEVARLQIQLDEARAAAGIAKRIADRLETVCGDCETATTALGGEWKHGLFGEVFAIVDAQEAAHPDEQVLETIGKMAKAANGEVGTKLTETQKLRNVLDILGRLVAISGYQKYLLLADAIEAGADQHLFSIRRSAVNTQDREMLVSRGLDGLAAYYAGGVKPEEIANFFRAVQVAASSAIAAKAN